jgi:septal ring factor EnvC (AmiA/AmiB activator)
LETALIAGQCNLLLANQKKKVMEQMSKLSQMQDMLATRETHVKRLENEADLMAVEVQKASRKLDSITEVIENYMVTTSMLSNEHIMSITI